MTLPNLSSTLFYMFRKALEFYLLFFLVVFIASEVFAQSTAPSTQIQVSTPPASGPEAYPGEKYLEETRQVLSHRVLRLADSIDSLFGDKRADDKRDQSTLRVSQRFYTKDGVPGSEDISATLNLYLPNLKRIENRLRDKLAETFESEKSNTPNGEVAKVSEKEKNHWSLNQESGLVLAIPVNYFARLRLRRDFLTNVFINSFYMQVGWSKSNEWEEVNSLNSDYALSRNLLFRFVNEIDWGMTNNSLSSGHGPSIIHEISKTEAISYNLRLNNALEGHTIYSNRASLGSTYRRLLPNGWVFLELNPEIAWERTTEFHPLYNFFVKVEFVFGSI